jgi:hypothetical protein
MKLLRAVMILSLALTFSVVAKADSVLGVPVTGIGSTTQAVPTCSPGPTACYNPTSGTTTFFIPLKASTSGIFGVTNSNGVKPGTFADTGTGTSNALTIYLLFSPVNLPIDTATLSFTFVDLDLAGGNDPALFFETVRFYSEDHTPLTPLITSLSQSGSGSNGYLAFVISGGSGSQTIFFPDVTGIVENPFYVELKFGSQWNQKGTNTPESMTATLTTTQTPIPEPGTLLLVGTGLAVGAFRRRFGNA